jgi:hypothetical protein
MNGFEAWPLPLSEGHRMRVSEEYIWIERGWSDWRLEKTAKRRAEWLTLFAKYDLNYQVGEDEISWACNVNDGEEDRVYVIRWEARMRDTSRKTKMYFVA